MLLVYKNLSAPLREPLYNQGERINICKNPKGLHSACNLAAVGDSLSLSSRQNKTSGRQTSGETRVRSRCMSHAPAVNKEISRKGKAS